MTKPWESLDLIVRSKVNSDGELENIQISVETLAQGLRQGTPPLSPPEALRERGGVDETRRWRLVLPQTASKGPNPAELLQALTPLHKRRKGLSPLYYSPPDGLTGDDAALAWMEAHADVLYAEPHYLLLVGSIDDLPFALQQCLSLGHTVGRLSLPSLEAYAQYALRVVRAETNRAPTEGQPVGPGQGFLFLPDLDPATTLTHNTIVGPLRQRLPARKKGLTVTVLEAAQALRYKLLPQLEQLPPASLLVTGSHGCEHPVRDSIFLGALQDQAKDLVRGSDIPPLSRCVEDGLVVLFACNSAGCHGVRPVEPLAADGDGRPRADILAQLPVAMLSHPRGPLAVVGHVDPIWVVGMRSRDGRLPDAVNHPGLVGFQSMAERLVQGKRLGEATWPFREAVPRHLLEYQRLCTVQLEKVQSGKQPLTQADHQALVYAWIAWNDARCWVILGDPAVRLRSSPLATSRSGSVASP